jgi:hypothetical protein
MPKGSSRPYSPRHLARASGGSATVKLTEPFHTSKLAAWFVLTLMMCDALWQTGTLFVHASTDKPMGTATIYPIRLRAVPLSSRL